MEFAALSRRALPWLSQSARRRLLDELRDQVMQRYTRDPAMPGPLRSLIGAMIRVFWVDVVFEIDQADRATSDDTGEAPSGEEEEVQHIACGMLQVLIVEARNLAPVHGIGTNPYIRAILGQQAQRSPTAWSNLRPAFRCLMQFPVVSLNDTLEIQVISQAPLFGGDTRLGYVSLPLKDFAENAAKSQGGTPPSSQLAYRCEPLQGASQGELVLILDYRARQQGSGHAPVVWFGWIRKSLRRWAAQFRAFFLYHYWPCDKSIFQMYLKEPVDITLLLISLSPFVLVRAIFYTVLLLCLCIPWPPDEHQIVQFILALKGLAVITDGATRVAYGLVVYQACARAGTCAKGGTPGTGVGAVSIVLDLYQEILVWCVCFLLLPKTVTFRARMGTKASATEADWEQDAHRGGRMKALLKYNLMSFATCFGIFLMLSLRDVIAVGTSSDNPDNAWQWRIPENYFWSRALFGLSMFPFLFLLHPQINKLLTHSTPTGYTRLGTLRRHGKIGSASPKKDKRDKQDTPDKDRLSQSHVAAVEGQGQSASSVQAASAPKVDPVEDLKAAIRWFPGGSLALFAGDLGLRTARGAVNTVGAIVSLEIRAASSVVSLGLRAVDAGVSTAQHVAHCVPGSEIALQAGGAAVSLTQRLAYGYLSLTERVARQLPGGALVLDVAGLVLCEVGFLAAAAESPGLTADEFAAAAGDAQALLQVATERAEALKLEAAARLADLLTRAEKLAEREAAEAIDRVRPEIGKIAQALNERGKGLCEQVDRAYGACDTLSRSVWAWSWDLALRLPTVAETFLGVMVRELEDLNAQRPGRAPGLLPVLEAYSRVILSSVCEAFLELRPPVPRCESKVSGSAASRPGLPRTESLPSMRTSRTRLRRPFTKGETHSATRRAASSSPPSGGLGDAYFVGDADEGSGTGSDVSFPIGFPSCDSGLREWRVVPGS